MLAHTHCRDEIALLAARKLGERLAVLCMALAIDFGQRRAEKVDEWRTHIADPNAQQRLVRRYRALLIDEMRDASLARTRHQGFADGFESARLVGSQDLEGNALRP